MDSDLSKNDLKTKQQELDAARNEPGKHPVTVPFGSSLKKIRKNQAEPKQRFLDWVLDNASKITGLNKIPQGNIYQERISALKRRLERSLLESEKNAAFIKYAKYDVEITSCATDGSSGLAQNFSDTAKQNDSAGRTSMSDDCLVKRII